MAGKQQENDIEALQAQIDLSNSVAFDIVSSWMKPSSSTKSTVIVNGNQSSSSKTVARDLEEHARRPPRLGLGATVSQSTAVALRETARLKGKLSKKSVGDGDKTSLSDDKKRKKAIEEEDDEESRNTAIVRHKPATMSKRAMTDVFASRGKKRKRSNSHSEPTSAAPTLDQTVLDMRETKVASPSPPTVQRKDKGKGSAIAKSLSTTVDLSHHLFDEEWTGFTEEVLNSIQSKDDDVQLSLQGPPSTPSSSSPPQSESERQAVSLSPVSRRVIPPSASTSAAAKTDDQIPLLNLHGPPSLVENSDPHGDKKKRKRRKRKKRKLESEQEHEMSGGGATE